MIPIHLNEFGKAAFYIQGEKQTNPEWKVQLYFSFNLKKWKITCNWFGNLNDRTEEKEKVANACESTPWNLGKCGHDKEYGTFTLETQEWWKTSTVVSY